MKPFVVALASLRLTMWGFGLLAVALLASYDRPELPVGVIIVPLALLGANLAAAIASRPVLRRGGLGLFHVSLLALLALAGYGRLAHFDGRVEVMEGAEFEASQVEMIAHGPWHGRAWRHLAFRQGNWEVDYAPGMRRAHTRSQAWLPGERVPRVVGDDTPLVLDGYRLYTTHNKGFAPVLTWQPEGGPPLRGALHMPSYPLFDWKQENRWRSPDGRDFKFWLRLEQPPTGETAWTLDPHKVPAVLVVEGDGARHELRPGESVHLARAVLRYDRLTGWMGYRIFYDPTLLPMLIVSILGVLALAWHLWGRAARLLPLREGAAA